MRVLHYTPELDGGGVERILFDYCTRMAPDVMSDFIVSSPSVGILEKPLTEAGFRIFHVPAYRVSYLDRVRWIKRILAQGNYDAVHDHSGYKSLILLEYARRAGVPIRIAHSHMADVPERRLQTLTRRLLTPLARSRATDLYACGRDAGQWMWGDGAVASERFRLMVNGVSASSFAYSEENRRRHRRSLGIDDEQLVVGNVARLSDQKNHQFLLRVFAELLSVRPKALLLLVGGGELLDAVEAQTRELGIEAAVRFLGVRDDVPELLSAMDVFVLPSKYEGLPVSLIEVQANGLPIVTSTAVTPEVRLSPAYKALSLEDSPRRWADEVLLQAGKRLEDVSSFMQGWDIEIQATRQKDWYLSKLKKQRS